MGGESSALSTRMNGRQKDERVNKTASARSARGRALWVALRGWNRAAANAAGSPS